VCVVLSNKERPDLSCQAGDVIGASGSLKQQAPTFVVTHSLGSAILIDTLGEMLGECIPSREQCAALPDSEHEAVLSRIFIDHLKGAFLLANQLPLIYLSRIPLEPVTPNPSQRPPRLTLEIPELQGAEFPASFRELAEALRGLREPIPIIAFCDMNDLLTFPVPAGWRDRITPGAGDRLQVVNIRITNAPVRWLGLAVNPSRAHTTYWTNRKIIEFVVKGN
jgi:hypothetical protein